MTREEFWEAYGKNLNPAQWEAVQTVDGAVLLLAVPGSGKTTVLVTRLGYMVCCQGIDPRRILTMTYTVAATKEMQARFSWMFGENYGSAMEFRTINGLSQKIIQFASSRAGRPAFRLQDNEGELNRLIRELYTAVNEEYPTDGTVREARLAITYIKNRMLTDAEIQELDLGIQNLPEIYTQYCQTLRSARQMDYDDQLLYALNLLQKSPAVLSYFQEQYPYLCVDEAQDTSKVQHEIIRLLASRSGNIFMVGDEDQSIYGFRAAYPEALAEFEQTYENARVLMMEENYRSTAPIIEAANRFVARNLCRREKQMRCTRGDGSRVEMVEVRDRFAQYPYLMEIARGCREETAVLYRNNDSAIPLIDLLERAGIPYNCRRFDDVFFSNRILADIRDILSFAYDPADTECYLRIYYKLNGHISKKQAQAACAKSEHSGRPVLEELLRLHELSRKTRDTIQDLCDDFSVLPKDTAPDALRRVCSAMGYREYLDNNQMDAGKVAILEMIGAELESPMALLNRLDELRNIIAAHQNCPETKFLLSTIHSSKGLEYDHVYLLDVLDGILPAIPLEQAKEENEKHQYQEERRLCYVGMTRAKKRLTLFHSLVEPSEFIREIHRHLEEESMEEEEYLRFLPTSAVGKRYRHAGLGEGRIIAQSDNGMLLEFSNGSTRLMTVGEMIDQREKTYRPRPKPKKIKEMKKEPEKSISPDKIAAGDAVEHAMFGKGRTESVDMETIVVRFEDGKVRHFLKSAVIPTGKLKKV